MVEEAGGTLRAEMHSDHSYPASYQIAYPLATEDEEAQKEITDFGPWSQGICPWEIASGPCAQREIIALR